MKKNKPRGIKLRAAPIVLSFVILGLLVGAVSYQSMPVALDLDVDESKDTSADMVVPAVPSESESESVAVAVDDKNNEEEPLPGQLERDLWAQTVHRYLQEDLWNDQNAYDAGHYLMVPVHAAFELDEDAWQRAFAAHFARFLHAIDLQKEALTAGRLARLQYLYLASRFAVAAEKTGKGYLVSPDLVYFLYDEIHRLWAVEPAWQWARDPFEGGIRERLTWKLETDGTKLARSYYRAIIDEELFLIAIAADLRAYERLTKSEHRYSATIDEVLNTARTILLQEVVPQTGGGWLFQPGVWTDHPDYAYAGNADKYPEIKPAPVVGIAQDSSHSHRFPLWLTSLSDAYDDDSLEKEFYVSLKQGLERQFFNKVLVMPTPDFPAVRLTNFMDGSNGVYRWGYQTQGEGAGYGPYELSGTFILGWWSFLGSQRIADVYRELSAQFPLPEKVIDVYVGPNTLRERHELVSNPESYHNGFRELLVILAADLAELEKIRMSTEREAP